MKVKKIIIWFNILLFMSMPNILAWHTKNHWMQPSLQTQPIENKCTFKAIYNARPKILDPQAAKLIALTKKPNSRPKVTRRISREQLRRTEIILNQLGDPYYQEKAIANLNSRIRALNNSM